MVRVKLFANFREIAGEKEVEIEAESVAELLEKLVERFPELERIMFEEGKLKNYVNIMVNGRFLRGEERIKEKLETGDIVSIFPPVSGG